MEKRLPDHLMSYPGVSLLSNLVCAADEFSCWFSRAAVMDKATKMLSNGVLSSVQSAKENHVSTASVTA